MGQVLEATESFATEIDGSPVVINQGHTRVDSDHPLALRFPMYFRPIETTYGVEEATAEPGRARNRPTPPPAPAPKPAKAKASEPETKASTGGLTTADLRKGT